MPDLSNAPAGSLTDAQPDPNFQGAAAATTPAVINAKIDLALISGFQMLNWFVGPAHSVTRTRRDRSTYTIQVPAVTEAMSQLKVQMPVTLPDGTLANATISTEKVPTAKMLATGKALYAKCQADPKFKPATEDHRDGQAGHYNVVTGGNFVQGAGSASGDEGAFRA